MGRPRKVQPVVVQKIEPSTAESVQALRGCLADDPIQECDAPSGFDFEDTPVTGDLELDVPTESYSQANDIFRLNLDRWLDEIQRKNMHRGETLVLRAPKE